MTTTLSVRDTDLRRLLDVVTVEDQPADAESMVPRSMLAALQAVVSCDQITYQVADPYARRWVKVADLVPEDGLLPFDDDFFWSAYWSSLVCSYPQVTGDRTTVTRSADFVSDAEFGRSAVGELFRLQHSRHNVVLPLAADGPIDHRIELWRESGSTFDEHDMLLLSLLRPHLAEFELQARRRIASVPLTARQRELVGLLAEGLTNRQVARCLAISEGTVRRHLENVYERLGVTSRAAAVASCLGSASPTARSSQSITSSVRRRPKAYASPGQRAER
jgi:DNA-binding CsgD family transcriptional regulator